MQPVTLFNFNFECTSLVFFTTNCKCHIFNRLSCWIEGYHVRISWHHPKQKVKFILWDIPLRCSEGHRQLHFWQDQVSRWLSHGLAGAYCKDNLHCRTFGLERCRTAIWRGYRRIREILTTFLHPVIYHEYEDCRQVLKGFHGMNGMFIIMQFLPKYSSKLELIIRWWH